MSNEDVKYRFGLELYMVTKIDEEDNDYEMLESVNAFENPVDQDASELLRNLNVITNVLQRADSIDEDLANELIDSIGFVTDILKRIVSS